MIYGEHCVANWAWHVEPLKHPGYTIWGCWGGTGELKVGNQRYHLSAGDIFFLDYREAVHGTQGDTWLQVRCIDFEELPIHVNGVHKVMHSHFMGSLFSKFKNSATRDEQKLWLSAILLEFNSLNDDFSKENKLVRSITSLHELIEEHPELLFSIKKFAQSVHYNTDHFIREYKKAYGISPYQQRQKLRYEKAYSLLCHSSFSVSKISELCGFDTPNSFTKFFHKYSGFSPVKLRKKHQTQTK